MNDLEFNQRDIKGTLSCTVNTVKIKRKEEISTAPAGLLCVHVLPAFRNAKMSPGIASKIVSSGARESAHPMIAQ